MKKLRVKVEMNHVPQAIQDVFSDDMNIENTVFLCIGTDRSTGDSLGPMVGSRLKRRGYQVFGTLKYPVHAMNLEETINKLPKGKYIVAIDACLGQLSSVKLTQVFQGSIKPGSGVDKDLPRVGDYGISPIVNVGGFMEYFVLQNTRLDTVMELTSAICKGLHKRFLSTKMVSVTK